MFYPLNCLPGPSNWELYMLEKYKIKITSCLRALNCFKCIYPSPSNSVFDCRSEVPTEVHEDMLLLKTWLRCHYLPDIILHSLYELPRQFLQWHRDSRHSPLWTLVKKGRKSQKRTRLGDNVLLPQMPISRDCFLLFFFLKCKNNWV